MKFSPPRNCNFSSEGTSEISQLRSGWFFAQRFFQVPQGRRTFSAVLSGRDFFRAVFQPLRSWLISGCRSATQFAVAAMVLFFAVGARAETTNDLSDAETQGRQLAKQLYWAQPETNLIRSGTLEIHTANGIHTNISMIFATRLTPTNWVSEYSASPEKLNGENLKIIHSGVENVYDEYESNGFDTICHDVFSPFANSDFWICDLGLEFFHWPEQKLLKKEVKRSRGCSVLESTNPNPSTNGYSRVVSWIDSESGGIVQAYAYDAQGKLLKEFYPKDFEKVNGQWQVQEMEMINDQTGSRSRIEFDLKK
jgi:hypothetical protein